VDVPVTASMEFHSTGSAFNELSFLAAKTYKSFPKEWAVDDGVPKILRRVMMELVSHIPDAKNRLANIRKNKTRSIKYNRNKK
jgi:hypothetical protein